MNFRETLRQEFERRQRSNPRYSLRAFARFLGTDHSTLSQILRGRRSLSPRLVRLFGKRLKLSSSLILESCVEQDSQAVLRLARSSGLIANSRWIAVRSGIPLDGVNAALHWLIYKGELAMEASGRWVLRKPATGNNNQIKKTSAPIYLCQTLLFAGR